MRRLLLGSVWPDRKFDDSFSAVGDPRADDHEKVLIRIEPTSGSGYVVCLNREVLFDGSRKANQIDLGADQRRVSLNPVESAVEHDPGDRRRVTFTLGYDEVKSPRLALHIRNDPTSKNPYRSARVRIDIGDQSEFMSHSP